MNRTLYVVKPIQTGVSESGVRLVDYEITPHEVDVAHIQCGVPDFEILRPLIGLGTGDVIERVTILFDGKAAQMFIDESGLLRDPPLLANPLATCLYQNAMHQRLYNREIVPSCMDLLENKARPGLSMGLLRQGLVVVGPVAVWLNAPRTE